MENQTMIERLDVRIDQILEKCKNLKNENEVLRNEIVTLRAEKEIKDAEVEKLIEDNSMKDLEIEDIVNKIESMLG